jgi:CubicO group peptidase (beta-lactamase class C family)
MDAMQSISALRLARVTLAPLALAALCAAAASATAREPYPHATEPIGTVREMYNGQLTPPMAVNTFRNIDRLFPSRAVARAPKPVPLPRAAAPLNRLTFTDRGKNYDLDTYLELNRVAGVLVLKNGEIKLERYRFGNTEKTRWMSMSVAKSITSTLVGVALKDGHIASLADPVTKYVPSLAGSAYDGVAVRDVLTMSSGVRWNETYTDPDSDRRRFLEAQISQVPGATLAVLKQLPRAAASGAVNNYSTGETQVATHVVRNAVGRPLATYLSERIWSRIGTEADATWWLESPDGVEIGGSGFSATLRDYGRFGLFMLKGMASGEAMLPAGWIGEATAPKVLRGGAPLAYGYKWWTPRTAASKEDGAFSARGIFGQRLYVNPAENVVIVIWGAQTHPSNGEVVNDWVFFDAVVDAVD